MAISDRRLRELAVQMAAVMDAVSPPGDRQELPQVRQIAARNRMDAVTRESHIRMINSLRRFYKPFGMDVIVNQALVGRGSLESLDDDSLVDLLRDIDRARECISDGIGFEEAGLIRNVYTGTR